MFWVNNNWKHFTPGSSVSIVNFEQVNAGSVRNQSCRIRENQRW